MTSKKSFLNSVKWAYTGNWGERSFSALFTIVLAALLGPRDFGTVAIAMIYIAFLQMFLDQGFMAALIQKKNLKPEHLDAVFWMDLVLSLFLVGTSILLSGWWAAKNHTPEAATLISVLSLCIPIEGLAAVQSAILSRNMDFRALSIRSNIAVLFSGVIGIGMAIAGFRVWALVGQQLARESCGLASAVEAEFLASAFRVLLAASERTHGVFGFELHSSTGSLCRRTISLDLSRLVLRAGGGWPVPVSRSAREQRRCYGHKLDPISIATGVRTISRISRRSCVGAPLPAFV